jgi:predicted PurR-regulated permease PerM
MNSKTTISPLVISTITLAALFVVLLGMQVTSDILSPILLAFVLAICTTPFMNWFKKQGLSSGLALVVTLVLDIILVLAIVWLIIQSVDNLVASLPEYEERFTEIEESVGGAIDNMGIDAQALAGDGAADPTGLIQLAADFASGLVAGLSNWGLIVILGVIFLVEATSMPRKLESLLHGDPDPTVRNFVRLIEGLRQYMVINAAVGAMAAVLNTILLAVVGVEGAVLWGVLSFFLSFVPSIGFLISVIPPAIMALVQFGWQTALIVVVLYIIINFLVDNVIKPKFIQEGVNISVLVTFVSLIVWGWVLGPIGAILAVPMAIIIQTVLESREETRWMAYLMGSGEKPYDPDPEADQDEPSESELVEQAAP